MTTYRKEAFTFNCGYNCGAIRYKLDFPTEGGRSMALSSDKSNWQGDIRFPQSAVCFCNDCRRACGSLVLFAIMCPIEQTSFSFARKSSLHELLEITASQYFSNPTASPNSHSASLDDTYLSLYQSSEKALRAFCSICGTPFLFVYTPLSLPTGVSTGGLDIYLSTLNRAGLESLEGLDRFAHCKDGMDWVKKLFIKDQSSDRVVRWHQGSNLAEFF